MSFCLSVLVCPALGQKIERQHAAGLTARRPCARAPGLEPALVGQEAPWYYHGIAAPAEADSIVSRCENHIGSPNHEMSIIAIDQCHCSCGTDIRGIHVIGVQRISVRHAELCIALRPGAVRDEIRFNQPLESRCRGKAGTHLITNHRDRLRGWVAGKSATLPQQMEVPAGDLLRVARPYDAAAIVDWRAVLAMRCDAWGRPTISSRVKNQFQRRLRSVCRLCAIRPPRLRPDVDPALQDG